MPRIAIGLHYEGSSFHGWQIQPGYLTVQEVLEKALSNFCKMNVRVIVAGRTDAGVHALGQVVHFDTSLQRSKFSWVRGINTFLPKTVAVQWAEIVPDDFHARFSAVQRTYDYILISTSVRSPLLNKRVGWLHTNLDIDAMREASDFLLGKQDFSSFRSSDCQAKSPCKVMYRVDVARNEQAFRFRFVANAFLHHMVRNMVGCLLAVGRKNKPPLWLKKVIDGRDRTKAAPTFSAEGLYLSEVKYDEKFSFLNELITKNSNFSEMLLPLRVPMK